jgi:hypothetical protein
MNICYVKRKYNLAVRVVEMVHLMSQKAAEKSVDIQESQQHD